MALIAIWMVSIENRSILFRRYFPSNGTKTNDGKMVAMLTMKEESQFVSGLMSSLGIDSSFSNASNSDSEYSFSFDCTQINQLPALGFNLKGYKLWPIIVLEHKGILFCGLPVVNNTSSNLIDHIGVSVTVSTLHSLINHFSKDNRLFLLEDYFTKNLPFGSQITNPYELEDDTFNKTDSETKASTSSSSTSSSKQELVLTVRITEFISSSEPDNEMIHGTVYITNNIVFSGNPLLTYRVDNLNELNPILSPHCWLNNSNFSSSISSSSSSTSSSPASVSSSSFSCICSKLNSKALRFFHYKCNPGLISEPFIQYNYSLTRKSDLISHLDLSITIKKANLMRFHSFRINFNRLPQSIISRLSNCAPSQGQLHMDKQNGFYWIVGTKIPKSGKLRLNADINCQTLSAEQFDASANFRVDNYTHGYPRPRGENFTLSDNLYSINFKLTPQLTLATFDYRLKATLI